MLLNIQPIALSIVKTKSIQNKTSPNTIYLKKLIPKPILPSIVQHYFTVSHHNIMDLQKTHGACCAIIQKSCYRDQIKVI